MDARARLEDGLPHTFTGGGLLSHIIDLVLDTSKDDIFKEWVKLAAALYKKITGSVIVGRTSVDRDSLVIEQPGKTDIIRVSSPKSGKYNLRIYVPGEDKRLDLLNDEALWQGPDYSNLEQFTCNRQVPTSILKMMTNIRKLSLPLAIFVDGSPRSIKANIPVKTIAVRYINALKAENGDEGFKIESTSLSDKALGRIRELVKNDDEFLFLPYEQVKDDPKDLPQIIKEDSERRPYVYYESRTQSYSRYVTILFMPTSLYR